MGIQDFKAGQRVAVLCGRPENIKETQLATVSRVDRKIVYIILDGFCMETGYCLRNKKDRYLVENIEVGTPAMLFPNKQAADDYIELMELRSWFLQAFNWSKIDQYTAGELRAVKQILEK